MIRSEGCLITGFILEPARPSSVFTLDLNYQGHSLKHENSVF